MQKTCQFFSYIKKKIIAFTVFLLYYYDMTIKTSSLVLCSVAVIFAQQAEPYSQQYMLEQQPQPQVQQYPPPPPMPQLQQPSPPMPQLQQPQQAECLKSVPQPKVGLYARFNLNNVSYGFNSKQNKDIDMGIGFGGGLIRRIPITNSLDVNPEIGFSHRNLYGEKKSDIKTDTDPSTGIETKKNHEYWEDETEFVWTFIPVIAQLTPFEIPLYVAAGFQVDLPILANLTITEKNAEGKDSSYTKRYKKDRAWYDLGVVWGIGYNITERFSFNFRSVVGLTSVTGKRADARTNNQYGIGVAFF